MGGGVYVVFKIGSFILKCVIFEVREVFIGCLKSLYNSSLMFLIYLWFMIVNIWFFFRLYGVFGI